MHHRFVGITIVALVAGGCAKGESGERAPDIAARPDSSAAGYAVGAGSEAPAALRPDSVPSSTPSAAERVVPSAAAAPRAAPASSATAPPPAVGGGGRKVPAVVTHPARTPPARQVPDTAPSPSPAPATPAPAAPTAAGAVRVNEFLSYDASAKTATLQLVGGYNGLNGALNFNGGAKGSQTITIPLGWRVQASFVNRDGDLPHSAIVVREVSPIPLESPPAAFPRAFTIKLEEGLQAGGADDLSFVANKQGRFFIFCGVPGHGQGGMWIHLVVSPSVQAPTYQ